MRKSTTGGRSTAARAIFGTCVLALLSLLLTTPALAAGPFHARDKAGDISGLNRACGAAVDSEGDVYASSAGEGKVKVYDPAHALLTSISNANEPCGLAVDTGGNLYVSEKATGNVVRYHPTAYPFAGTPSYEAPVTIDSSGNAEGVGVDPTDSRLYVAEGNHVSVYDAKGNLGIDEAQRVLPFFATGGTFKLKFGGGETGSIPYNANAATVKTALETIPALTGNVAVEEQASSDFLITFTGALARADVELFTADSSGLEGGGSQTVFIEEKTKGFSGHVGEGKLSAATGVGAYTYETNVNESTRYLFVADGGTDQALVFSGPDVRALKFRRAIKGPKAGEDFGFGAAGSALAVDSATGHFLVYDDAHSAVDEFDATGEFLDRTANGAFEDAEPAALAVYPQRNEVQALQANATGGSFKLSFEGQETAAIPHNAEALPVRVALEALSTIGAGNVFVGEGPTGEVGPSLKPYSIIFRGKLGNRDVPQLIANGALTGGTATITVSTTTAGSGPGRLYVGAGSGSGAELLAFKALTEPKRELLEGLSGKLTVKQARAIATDRFGDVYVSAEAKIYVFDSSGKKLLEVEDSRKAYRVAVDSTGKVYVLDGTGATEQLTYYTPSTFPPTAATTYTRHAKLFEGSNIDQLAVDPVTDRVYIGRGNSGGAPSKKIQVFSSAKDGSTGPVIFASFFEAFNGVQGLAVYGANGSVYAAEGSGQPINVLDKEGSETLTKVSGNGCPSGKMEANETIGADQSNGHVLEFKPGQQGEAAREYDAAGTCVAEFGVFSKEGPNATFAIATDNACAIHRNGEGKIEPLDETTTPTCAAFDPSNGNLYVAFDGNDNVKQPFDVTAFGPLSYGTGPIETKEFKLTVSKTGTGLGNVTSSPSGINCGSECSALYAESAKVTLTATPAGGSTFAGWSGSGCSGTSTCEVTMTEAKAVTASFDLEVVGTEFLLSVATEGGGTGTITSSPGTISCNPFCSDEFPEGTVVTLTATAAPGSIFYSWKHCDSGGVNGRQCTVTMGKAKTVSAVFTTTYDLSVSKAPGSGLGKVQASPGGILCLANCQSTTAAFKEGSAVTLKQTPAKHFHLLEWLGDCSGTGPCVVSMGEDHEVEAKFAEDTKHLLTLAKLGGGQGTVKSKPAGINCGLTCGSTAAAFYQGEVVELTATVGKGSTFGGWSGGGCSGTGVCNVTISEAKEVKAEFK